MLLSDWGNKAMNSTFWNGKRVLITGHTGFVGAWMSAVLDYCGLDSAGFSLEEEQGSLYEKIKGHLRIKKFYGDLREKEAVRFCIESVRPDVVFHIAAFGFVKECQEDPDRAYTTNVIGTLNLFQILKESGFNGTIVVASSDKVYRNNGNETCLFREEDPLGGTDPYSASKTCEDLLAQSYYDSYFAGTSCSMCIVRPSNILGGGDHNWNRLIPSIYNNLQHGKKPEIRNPDSVRPWQNILDMVDAYLTVAEQIREGIRIYNVGPETEGIKTVGEIAAFVSDLYGMRSVDQKEQKSAVKEKAFLGLSIDKIERELGWTPKRSLEQTLTEIYQFYNNDRGDNAYELCISQINDYYRRNGGE